LAAVIRLREKTTTTTKCCASVFFKVGKCHKENILGGWLVQFILICHLTFKQSKKVHVVRMPSSEPISFFGNRFGFTGDKLQVAKQSVGLS